MAYFLETYPWIQIKEKCPGNYSYSLVEGVNLSYFNNINLEFWFLVSIFMGRKIVFWFIESLNLLSRFLSPPPDLGLVRTKPKSGGGVQVGFTC